MIKILNERFIFYKNFELINNDILKIDLKNLISEKLNGELKTCKIIANLPYYITTPIIVKLLEEKLPLESITVMVQKEVAKRLTAIPGEKETGAITHLVYYYTDSEIVVNVPKRSFLPSPEVDSCVINLKFLKEPRIKVEDEKMFFKIIRSAFSQKRKTLVNSLLNNNIFASRKEAESALMSAGIDIKIRGEKLSIYDFEKIYKKILSEN